MEVSPFRGVSNRTAGDYAHTHTAYSDKQESSGRRPELHQLAMGVWLALRIPAMLYTRREDLMGYCWLPLLQILDT